MEVSTRLHIVKLCRIIKKVVVTLPYFLSTHGLVSMHSTLGTRVT